jgi:hypothetical protein
MQSAEHPSTSTRYFLVVDWYRCWHVRKPTRSIELGGCYGKYLPVSLSWFGVSILAVESSCCLCVLLRRFRAALRFVPLCHRVRREGLSLLIVFEIDLETTSVREYRVDIELLLSHVAISEWSEKRPIVSNRSSTTHTDIYLLDPKGFVSSKLYRQYSEALSMMVALCTNSLGARAWR